MNILSLNENLVSKEQANPELSMDVFCVEIASNGLMCRQSTWFLLAIWCHAEQVQLPEFDMINHVSMSTSRWTRNLVSNDQAHQGL